MTIPEPKTWVDGETVTPQMLNEQIRDVHNFFISGMPRIRMAQRVYDQVIPSGEWTNMQWDTMDYDTAGIWNALVPDKLTIAESGVYIITTNAFFGNSSAGVLRGVRIRSDIQGSMADQRTVPLGFLSMTASTIAYLSAGEGIEIGVFQNSGADMAMAGGGGPEDHSNVSLFRLSS
jgi:hypothetical protein